MPATALPPSARALAAQLQDGTLAPEVLAVQTLAAIAAAEPVLHAFTCTLDADAATAQARLLHGALAGLPVAVKDIFDTRDLPTAYGSPQIYPPRPATADAAIVALLRQAGALVIGKSVTTEFAYLHPAATTNPRAPGRTPGGSSSGSAAAVAAGVVPLAVGTQTGGSVVRPASYCGVVGYKPTAGWLPTSGLKCFSWSLDTVGLFSRDVADMAWFAEVLTGRALALPGQSAPPGSGRLVVGVPADYPWGALSANARAAIARGCQALEAAGVEVRPCRLPAWAATGFADHAVVQGHEAWRCLGWEFAHHADRLSAVLRDDLASTRAITPAMYEAAQRRTVQARAEAQAWLGGFDALLTPSAPDEPPAGLGSTGNSSFNRLWTLLGVPCINVPGLVGDHGAPMGLQLIAAAGADARLLQLAQQLEQALAS